MAKKKEEKKVNYNKLNMDEIAAIFSKKFGAGKMARASSSRALSVPRLETGVFAVDYATGGGFPIGRISGLFGKKSSAKTWTALRLVASAQKYCRTHLVKMEETKKKLYRCLECGFRGEKEGINCPDCEAAGFESTLVDMGDHVLRCPHCKEYKPFETVWMDAEGAWENRWAAQQGVNCHYVYMIRTEFAEQAVDISDVLLRSGKCDLLVVDTLAHLIPSQEIEESSSKWQMGLQARLINKMLRKMVSAQNSPNLDQDNRPTIILLNQIRMKLGVMFGDPEVKPGGMGQEFATSVDLKMWPGKYEKDGIGNTLSLIANFRVVKNKVSPPQQEGNFRIWLRDVDKHTAGDTEEFSVVLGQALKIGLFGEYDKDNQTTVPEGGWKWGNAVFNTQEELTRYFREDANEFSVMRTSLFKCMLGTIASDDDALAIEDDDNDTMVEEMGSGSEG